MYIVQDRSLMEFIEGPVWGNLRGPLSPRSFPRHPLIPLYKAPILDEYWKGRMQTAPASFF